MYETIEPSSRKQFNSRRPGTLAIGFSSSAERCAWREQRTVRRLPNFLGTRANRAASERPTGLRYRLGKGTLATHTSRSAGRYPRDRAGFHQATSLIRARLCGVRGRRYLICAAADDDCYAQNRAEKKDSFHKVNSNLGSGRDARIPLPSYQKPEK